MLVNGSAHLVGRFAGVIRHLQSGYLYHYAFAMILGLIALLSWILYTYIYIA
jgi:NADH-quinone oxidoreductase subunit L